MSFTPPTLPQDRLHAAKRAAELIHARFEEHMTRNDDGEVCERGESGYSEEQCLLFAIEEVCENEGMLISFDPAYITNDNN